MQSKVEDGLSKIQGGIQQGKERLRQSQELKKLMQDVQTTAVKRAELLYALGEKLYSEIRTNEINGAPYEKWIESIMEKDKAIYQLNETIHQIQSLNEEQKCECGAMVNDEDKFCGSCGKEVVKKKELSQEEMMECPSCETQVHRDSAFCKCCGVKMSKISQLTS